ncbi:beta-class carbonic anhydrase [Kineococcus radiotolerans]|uniref:carbonic anhydrase n=1 Tax=Kineococcus radiotolerans (strain ATCC BAA-149 / DSM 14245 / SRS30216) TaxID=266940 RepID=A6W6S6_KINRD|nr:carbonic anhydrase [Kineococcus radiotolerans SRS30216 = ATCC BAA-149]
MSRVDPFADVLTANAAYAETFVDDGRPGIAGSGLAVLTCMDSRISPLEVLGLEKGDAKILRNAGARVTDDVLRTLVLAHHLLGVQRVLVLAHTDCGMTKNTDADVHAKVLAQGVDSRSIEFRTIADQRATLVHDVQRIRSWPFLPPTMPVAGGVYDVRTGAIEMVVAADATAEEPPRLP